MVLSRILYEANVLINGGKTKRMPVITGIPLLIDTLLYVC